MTAVVSVPERLSDTGRLPDTGYQPDTGHSVLEESGYRVPAGPFHEDPHFRCITPLCSGNAAACLRSSDRATVIPQAMIPSEPE
jgi:hypothetical protein